jgi:hypothetical protein
LGGEDEFDVEYGLSADVEAFSVVEELFPDVDGFDVDD